MIVSEDRTILKDRKFIGVFVIGLACAIASIIIRAVYTSQGSKCISDAFCSGYNLCFENGYTYCCGSYSGSYSCGSYSYSCSRYGDYNEYDECAGLITAQWVMSFAALVALIGLILISKRHQTKKLQYMAPLIQNQNIIYSDAPIQNVGVPVGNVGVPVGNINQSVNEYPGA